MYFWVLMEARVFKEARVYGWFHARFWYLLWQDMDANFLRAASFLRAANFFEGGEFLDGGEIWWDWGLTYRVTIFE